MPVRRQENVAELDVTVNDALGVDVVKCRRQLREPLENAVLIKFGGLDVRERARGAVLGQDEIHHEIRRPRRLIEVQVEDMDEVRIVKTCEDLPLGQELALQDIDMSVLNRKGLQRVMDAELHMFDLIDRTHAALAEEADDTIGSKQLSRRQFHLNISYYIIMRRPVYGIICQQI